MDRHVLIAEATGTGKTKTIQVFIRGVFGVLMKCSNKCAWFLCYFRCCFSKMRVCARII
ncbi:hypothetical protein [Flavobacterium sp.]|uniref:hypothetical protein n=1 Tax=Flavobacterium sp. TaxID=239 RepID=UPI0033410A7E